MTRACCPGGKAAVRTDSGVLDIVEVHDRAFEEYVKFLNEQSRTAFSTIEPHATSTRWSRRYCAVSEIPSRR